MSANDDFYALLDQVNSLLRLGGIHFRLRETITGEHDQSDISFLKKYLAVLEAENG